MEGKSSTTIRKSLRWVVEDRQSCTTHTKLNVSPKNKRKYSSIYKKITIQRISGYRRITDINCQIEELIIILLEFGQTHLLTKTERVEDFNGEIQKFDNNFPGIPVVVPGIHLP